MTTLVRGDLQTLIESDKDLGTYFDAFIKTQEHMQVGLEAEFLGVFRDTGKVLPYEGHPGVEMILRFLALFLSQGSI